MEAVARVAEVVEVVMAAILVIRVIQVQVAIVQETQAPLTKVVTKLVQQEAGNLGMVLGPTVTIIPTDIMVPDDLLAMIKI